MWVILLLQLAAPTWPPTPDFQKSVDYLAWYEACVRAGRPESENAAVLYRRAMPAWDLPLLDMSDSRRLNCRYVGPTYSETPSVLRPWNPSEHPDWEQSYIRLAPVLTVVHDAARKSYVWYGAGIGEGGPARWVGPLESAIFSRLSAPSELSFCVYALADAAWRAPDGRFDGDNFVRCTQTQLAIQRQVAGTGSPMARDRAGLITWSVSDALAQKLLSGAQLRALLQSASLTDELTAAAGERAIAVELAMRFERLQAYVLGPEREADGADVRAARAALRRGDPQPAQCAKRLRSYFEEYSQLARLPFTVERRAALVALGARASADSLVPPLCDLCNPAVADSTSSRALNWLRLRGLAISLALHAYREKAGVWPSTLDELREQGLSVNVTDPCSGSALVYRLVNGAPLLYSVGGDGRDNGGVSHERHAGLGEEPPADCDYILWPYETR